MTINRFIIFLCCVALALLNNGRSTLVALKITHVHLLFWDTITHLISGCQDSRTVMLISPSISPPQRLVHEPSLMDCTSSLVLSLFALVMLVRPNSSVTPVS